MTAQQDETESSSTLQLESGWSPSMLRNKWIIFVSYICIHIEPTNLPDGTYELVPEAEEGPGLPEKLKWISQTPLRIRTRLQQPLTNTDLVLFSGKPRSMSYLFLNLCNLLLFLSTCAFKFTGVAWNLSCMIPRYLCLNTSMCSSLVG